MDDRLRKEWLQHNIKNFVKEEKKLGEMIRKITYKRDALTAEVNMCYEKIHKLTDERIAMQKEFVSGLNVANAVTDPQVPPPHN